MGFVSVCVFLSTSFAVAEPIVESRSGHSGNRPAAHAEGHHATRTHNTLSVPQIESLEQEIRNLRGQLEVQEHELKRLSKSQQDLYLDLERKMEKKGVISAETMPKASPVSVGTKPIVPAAPKLMATKPPAVTTLPKPAPASTSRAIYEPPMEMNAAETCEEEIFSSEGEEMPPQIPLSGLPIKKGTQQVAVQSEPVVELVEQPLTTAAETLAESPQLPPKPTLVVKGVLAEKNTYENAYNFVLNKRYPEAVTALEEFLTQYPKGQYAPNAHYWLGEVYSLQGRADKNAELLNKASIEFTAITTQFPNHQKAMDALLKLGIIESDRGNTEAARQYLTRVKERYPGTSVARIASTHLQRLK